MAKPKVRRDSRGIAEILKRAETAKPINALAHQMAALCGGEVETYTTDRAAALVKVPGYRQARDGALTRAATAVGLEVRMRQ